MKRVSRVGLILSLFTSTLIAIWALWIAGRSPQVVYVESNRILQGFSLAISANKAYATEMEKLENNLKTIEDSLNTVVTELKSGYEMVNNDKRKVLATRLTKWNEDYKRYSNYIREQAETRRAEIMKPVIESANGYIEIWCSENGYDLVLGTSGEGNIVYADHALNVTTPVLKALNEHYAEKQE